MTYACAPLFEHRYSATKETYILKLKRCELDALRQAYTEACRARGMYVTLIHRLRPGAPLRALREGTARHVRNLELLLQHSGIPAPEWEHGGAIRRFSTIPQAVDAAFSDNRRSPAAQERRHSVVREDLLEHAGD